MNCCRPVEKQMSLRPLNDPETQRVLTDLMQAVHMNNVDIHGLESALCSTCNTYERNNTYWMSLKSTDFLSAIAHPSTSTA